MPILSLGFILLLYVLCNSVSLSVWVVCLFLCSLSCLALFIMCEKSEIADKAEKIKKWVLDEMVNEATCSKIAIPPLFLDDLSDSKVRAHFSPNELADALLLIISPRFTAVSWHRREALKILTSISVDRKEIEFFFERLIAQARFENTAEIKDLLSSYAKLNCHTYLHLRFDDKRKALTKAHEN